MRDSRREHRVRKIARILSACLIAVIIVLSSALALSPSGGDMPTRIWIREPGAATQSVRIDSPSGPDFAHRILFSTMSAADGSVTGVSFRRSLSPLDKLKLRLLPRHRLYGAGYEATDRTSGDQGDVWHEFTMFDPHFDRFQYGWWPW